jgi:hypothetical protein
MLYNGVAEMDITDFYYVFVVIGVFFFGLVAGIRMGIKIQKERHEMEKETVGNTTPEGQAWTGPLTSQTISRSNYRTKDFPN